MRTENRPSYPQDAVAGDYDSLMRALLVERFTRWAPSTTADERTELTASPTLRDGSAFEPNRRNVRPRKFHRCQAELRRNS